MYTDGKNADRNAIDFKQTISTVDNSFKEKIHFAKGGGLAVILEVVE